MAQTEDQTGSEKEVIEQSVKADAEKWRQACPLTILLPRQRENLL